MATKNHMEYLLWHAFFTYSTKNNQKCITDFLGILWGLFEGLGLGPAE